MADESGFDPCECIFNHESSMQRLLNMLRQSQAYCSDVSCTNDMNEIRQGDAGGMSMVFGLLFAWVMITFSMIIYRTTQRGVGGSDKPDRSHNMDPEPPALS
uniref:Small integral membrane protein 14 n=1 Tax=Schistocephalus solidus TaxID=70667 RepID=A0A0X3NW77_SCHSO